MCRLAAYIGPEIPLENIVVAPLHSLLQQSQHAEQAKLAVNGDGFGIAWYGRHEEPGLYRDVLPAWADENLTSICRTVCAPVFLAHVRASTIGDISRVNCHPFVHGRWSFMHNGQIAAFARIRRDLENSLPDHLYVARRGTSDSELLFLLLLAHGLEDGPQAAFEAAITQITRAQDTTSRPNRLTCVLSDGDAVYALRCSSDARSPSLYVSRHLDHGGRALASEPLDGRPDNWVEVADGTFVTVAADRVIASEMFAQHTA